MFNAIIIKILSNKYWVVDENQNEFECVAMGKLRKGIIPSVGDRVLVEQIDDKYCIQKIKERKNSLIRPFISNVDQAIITMSCVEPDFSTTLLNRLIFIVSIENIEPIIVLTKCDLVEDFSEIDNIIKLYINAGYQVYKTSINNVSDDVRNIFKDKISVLTGQSGAGKSTLLNSIDDSIKLHTQEISKALGRGKHTTRHSQLYKLCGGWIGDTPGFSSLSFEHMELDIFKDSIKDFKPYIGQCKYANCTHIHEPGCKVKQQLESNNINKYLYDDYCWVAQQIKDKKIKY